MQMATPALRYARPNRHGQTAGARGRGVVDLKLYFKDMFIIIQRIAGAETQPCN